MHTSGGAVICRDYMFHNLLTDKGYTVYLWTNRAVLATSRDWRTGIYRFMGGKDLTDQCDGASGCRKIQHCPKRGRHLWWLLRWIYYVNGVHDTRCGLLQCCPATRCDWHTTIILHGNILNETFLLHRIAYCKSSRAFIMSKD